MADAQYGEGRQFNLHTAGTDLVEGSAIAVKGASGAISVDGFTETGVSALVALAVGGGTPHSAVDSGNPVKIGGFASAAPPVQVADEDRVNGWFSRFGAQVVNQEWSLLTPTDAQSNIAFEAAATSPSGSSGRLGVANYIYNGTTWDRLRSALGVTGSQSVGGPTASDAAIAVAPLTIGGRASNAAPTAVSADGDVVDARFTRTGALNVYLVDQAGAAASLGGGTQYAEDAALGAVGSATGTLTIGRASAAAPTSVTADNDAVGLWLSRFGAVNVILRDTAGAAVPSGTQYTEDAAVGATGTGTLVVARRDDALATLTPVEDDAVGMRVNNRGALWVSIADGSGNQITSFGGGTQYAVDAALGATPTGTLAVAIRDDALSALTPVEGDAIGLRVNAEGALWVHLQQDPISVTAGGAFPVRGFGVVDDPLSDAPVPFGGRASTAVPTAVSADGDLVYGRFLRTGALTVHMVDASGNAASVGGGTQYVHDDPVSATPTGTILMGRYDTTTPTAVGADGDAVAARMSALGSLQVQLRGQDDAVGPADVIGLTNNIALAVGIVDGNGTQITSFGGGTQYVEDVALGAVGSATGTLQMGRASATAPTAISADGDAVAAWLGRQGETMTGIGPGWSRRVSGTLDVLDETVVIDTDGAAVVGIDHRPSSWSGTVSWEATIDGTNWLAVTATGGNGGGSTSLVAGGASIWQVAVNGYRQFRVRASAYTSGSVVITLNASAVRSPVVLSPSGLAAAIENGDPLDGDDGSQAGLKVFNWGFYYDGSTGWDRVRGDLNGAWAQGNVVHDAADAGKPIKIGGRAYSAAPAAVSAANDRVDAAFTLRGALHSYLVDSAGAAITTGVQYIENAALTADAAQGTLVIGRRDDALSTLTPVEGDAIGLRVNSRGALWVAHDRTTDDFVSASATPTPGIAAALAPDRRYTSQALGTAANSTQAWDTNGAASVLVHVATTQTGTMTFEVSADGTNWVAAEARDVVLDLWISGTSFAPTANKVYRIVTNGWRSLRARTVTTLNGTVALTATLAAHSSVVNALDSGPAPHAIGYSVTGVSAQYTTTQTSTTLGPTVASTNRLVVTYMQIQTGGTTAGAVQVYFGTGAFSRGTSRPLFDGEFAPSNTSKPGVISIAPPGGWVGAADEELKVTDSAAINPLTVTMWYYLIPA